MARRVRMEFGSLRALDGANLTVQCGERHGIIGPNGAGKTTLFNILGGQLKASSGSVSVLGQDISNLPPHRRATLGLARTFQITNLFGDLTVLNNVLLALQGSREGKLSMMLPRTRKRWLHQEADRLLAEIGLTEERNAKVSEMAHGRQRIVEVALAFAARPKILLLDEPTAGLSEQEREEFVVMLERLDSRLTLVLIEHDMDVCFRLVDRITVLHRGRVIVEGPKEEIREDTTVQEIYLGVDR